MKTSENKTTSETDNDATKRFKNNLDALKTAAANIISHKIAIELFGADYKKNSGRVKDQEIISGIFKEALKDIDYLALNKNKNILDENFTPKIKEYTEPTLFGSTLKSMGQNNNRIQIKSITKEDRAKITKDLKELFSNEIKKVKEEEKRSISTPQFSSEPTPKKYKNVLILGSHVDKITKGIQAYITKDTLVIGNGTNKTLKNLIDDGKFKQLSDLDPGTNISILTHGTAFLGNHITEAGLTDTFLRKHILNSTKPYNIKLFSCYGGAAKIPGNSGVGSTLTTFSEDSRVLYGYKWTQKNMTNTTSKSSLQNSLDNIMEIACQTITLSAIDSTNHTFRAVIRPPNKMLYNEKEIVKYFDQERTKVIQEYNNGKSDSEQLSLESPFKDKDGVLTEKALSMAKKWRSRYFNHLMLGADDNKLLTSKERKQRNNEFKRFINSLEGNYEKHSTIVSNFINETKDTRTVPIHMAASIGNINAIDTLLKYGAKIDSKDENDNNILATVKDYKMAEYLISKKVIDINSKNKDDQTALAYIIEEFPAHILSDNKKTNLAYLHIKEGATINTELMNSTIIKKATKRLFKEAIKNNDTKLIKHLLKQKAHTIEHNYNDFIGYSGLGEYAKKKSTNQDIKQLIEEALNNGNGSNSKLPPPSQINIDYSTNNINIPKATPNSKTTTSRGRGHQ